MNNHFFNVILLFLFAGNVVFSQNYSANLYRSSGNPKITGSIINEDNIAVPFASVALYNLKDSSLITGTTTDENGKLSIDAKPGKYYIQISFLSYENKTIPNIQLGKEGVDLGTVRLVSSSVALEEVVVTGEKSQMQLHLDKRVFNVGKDLSNTGNNAAEILDNVPSVEVDIEGNVSLRGSENVRILIDGKPSGLIGLSNNDALRQIQGNLIESIEVITNPSARYDAEGEVGIINIILKKEKRRGVNGSFEITAGQPDNYRGSFSLNYRRDLVNLFINQGISYRKNPGQGYSIQNYFPEDTNYSYIRDRNHVRSDVSNNTQIGADFFINKYNSITVSGLFHAAGGENSADIVYKDYNTVGSLTNTETREDTEREDEIAFETAVNYRKTFPQKDRVWTIDFKYVLDDDTEKSDIIEKSTLEADPLYQRSSNTEDEKNWLFQTDYVHPFTFGGRFEAGLKSTIREIENDFTVEEKISETEWMIIGDYDNHFKYLENISAAYAIFSQKIDRFSYQLGMRLEYSDITTELVETNEKNHRNYTNLFPTAHLSYELGKHNTLQLSYTRRLSRPRFRHLLPFYGYSDDRNLFTGNPNLDPEFTHSFELGHLYQWEKGSILSSVYYRHTNGEFERITTVDSTGITKIYPINLSTEDSYGIEFNLNYDITDWWRFTGSANFFQAITDGDYEGKSYYSNTYSWMSRASTKLKINKTWDIQVSGRYRSPRETTQGTRKAGYFVDAGISRDILNNNGTITLSARDLFNSRKWRSTTEDEDYYFESEFQWRSREVMLSLIYRLNQKKDRMNGRRNGNGGDMDLDDGGGF